MKLITTCIAMSMWALALSQGYAQENTNKEGLDALKEAKENITANEKEALLQDVERINNQYQNDEITYEEAEQLKKEAAQKHALNIENKVAIINNQIELIERNGENAMVGGSRVSFIIGEPDMDDERIFGVKIEEPDKQKKRKNDVRTTSDLVFAFGLNNAIIEGQSLDESPYKIGGSRFAELGFAWKTRVFKNSNWLRVKYGVSFQFNGLKPDDNQYFVDAGDQTELQEFPSNLDKSKLRMDNLVIPVHFEFGPSKKTVDEDYVRYSTYKQIKIGLGGYAGVNINTLQKLKFDDDGRDVKQKTKANFNTNNFIYGVSGYIGWRGTAIYAKYDLNEIFRDNPVAQRNVSLGLRFDID